MSPCLAGTSNVAASASTTFAVEISIDSGKGQIVIGSEHLLIAACDKPHLVLLDLSVGSHLVIKDLIGRESFHSRAALRTHHTSLLSSAAIYSCIAVCHSA